MKTRYLILFLLFAGTLKVQATHIVGGGFNIVWLGGNTYELHLRVLRDCKNGEVGFNTPLFLGSFDKATDEIMDTIVMDLDSIRPVNFITTKCLAIPSGLCVEVGYYTKVITLSPAIYNNNAGYYFSWERCCRNKIIQNINNPEGAGMTFYMEIPPPKLIKNSTPKWHNNPRTLLCKDNPFKYNFNFVDPDGDSLYYSLVNPLKGNQDQTSPDNRGVPKSAPYNPTQWAPGFDNDHQITGSPPLTIDHRTGEIHVTPDVTGVFVSAIRVEEFRYGKKLGEVRLELQYTVSECSTNPFPVINYQDSTMKSLDGAVFNIKIPNQLCFDIISSDKDDSLFVTVSSDILTSTIQYKPEISQVDSGNKKTTTRFCWQTACELTGLGPQKFTVTVRDNGCPLPKTAIATFTINLIPVPLINPTRILCMTLVDNKETIIYWGDSTGNNPYFSKYRLYRSTDDTNYTVIDSISNKNIRQYNDINTPNYALINYSYFMRGVNTCGFEGPSSGILGTFEQLKFIPDLQKLITVTVVENRRLKIVWPPSKEKDFAQYLLYKSTRNNDNYKLIKNFISVYDTVYYDDDVNVKNTSYCYYLVMKDTCNNYGPTGQPSCSIVLKGKSTPFEHSLSWQTYDYWDNGNEGFSLYRKDTENPFAVSAQTNSAVVKYLDNELNYESGLYNYVVEAREKTESGLGFNGVSRSNEIELVQAPLLHVPNAFTANDDGINDDFGIRPVFVKDYHLRIYNRWGQMIFETTDKHQQWKGEGAGEFAQTDVYVYVATYTGWDESSLVKKGNVTLLK